MSSTLVIRGRTYTVEPIANSDDARERSYHLVGVRGARYRTIRNAHTPHLMFLVSARKFGQSSVTEGVWLSDADGALKVVQS